MITQEAKLAMMHNSSSDREPAEARVSGQSSRSVPFWQTWCPVSPQTIVRRGHPAFCLFPGVHFLALLYAASHDILLAGTRWSLFELMEVFLQQSYRGLNLTR